MRSIIKRDGRVVPFDQGRIARALSMAFRAEIGKPYPDPIPQSLVNHIRELTAIVVQNLNDSEITVEEVQDEVERTLMASSDYSVARRYIIYREARSKERELVTLQGNLEVSVNYAIMEEWLREAHDPIGMPTDSILDQTVAILPHQPTIEQIFDGMILTCRQKIEIIPEYTYVTSRLLLRKLYAEVSGINNPVEDVHDVYDDLFIDSLRENVHAGRLTPEIISDRFDLITIADALEPERDFLFTYLGLQTLYDRYFIRVEGLCNELPQGFWMRVAMGLALNEDNPTDRAIEMYNLMSRFFYCPSTPTLFNSGTLIPQLSSCYLTTISDDLEGIFKGISDNAQLQKWSGGLGNDWTSVRAMGAEIKKTNGRSNGVIPFLKIVNDTAVAVDQGGGKRRGAVCAYLEPWHADIEEFLDLRKNTGDDRRRTHDMHTSLWIPDLFMERVRDNGDWTLFSPETVPDLHDLYSVGFTKAYEAYEEENLPLKRTVRAVDLWRKILTATFETGHPWICFKDAANIRNPQYRHGVVHSSNLCTEITLNTSAEEIAVCNLASLNLPGHIIQGKLNFDSLAHTIRVAVRGLDNVINLNYYPVPEAEYSNTMHRPVGLGIMGWQDLLHILKIPFASEEALALADELMEFISYYAISASIDLAEERGRYQTFFGSAWDDEHFPVDTWYKLMEAREKDTTWYSYQSCLDWDILRDRMAQHGIRNSNLLAIAPTATISNIQGVSQSIEPLFSNLYVKSNLSGEFTVANTYLVDDLRDLGLWDQQMLDDLKYFDGSLREIERIPEEIKALYATAFEIPPLVLITLAAQRQMYIDQSQSLNLYVNDPSGRELSDMYFQAWEQGLKTTYYLRSKAATSAEKSTLDINTRGIQPRWMQAKSASADILVNREEEFMCEACQ